MRMLATTMVLAFATSAHAQPELRAGVARVEITPATFMPMYGYANRKCGPANGTHDPLFAKALVLQAGDSRLAIVTMDIGSMVSENLRRDVAAKLNIPVLAHSLGSVVPAVWSHSIERRRRERLPRGTGREGLRRGSTGRWRDAPGKARHRARLPPTRV